MPILDIADTPRGTLRHQMKAGQQRTLGAGNASALTGGNGGNIGGNGFAAARLNKLLQDFVSSSRSADQDLYGDNLMLRARCRNLALNDPFVRKFLAMVVQNVVGPNGFLMQAKVTSTEGKDTAQTKAINERIEEEYAEWCEKGSCTADGKSSFVRVQQMGIENWAREGENLVKFAYDRSFNRTGMALQLLDNDQLDDSMMQAGQDGSEIRMGVEVDRYRRPVAYWMFDGHPYDTVGGGNRMRKRIAAAAVVHTYMPKRPGQTRGYTQMSSVILQIHQLNRYYEAEVIAARFSAAKFMVLEEQANLDPEYGGDGDEDDEDEEAPRGAGNVEMGGESGAIVVPSGMTAKPIDFNHPTQAFASFSKTAIRAISTGLLSSYPTLGNDLEGVNFSSIRAGMLDERDSWRVIQAWFIDDFLKPIFREWLRMALLTVLSDISLTPAQMRQFRWRARGWEWVDPVKDADAAILRLQNGFSTYEKELGNLGMDFEETMATRAKEQALIKSLGLVLGTDLGGDQGGKGVAAGDESAAAEVDGAQGKGDAKPAKGGGK
jgi:lambda family phage portal protein